MLPLDIDLDNKKKFVEHYMKALDYCYSTKYYLYCYKFVSEGNGSYAKILCFTRKIYKRKQKKLITYNSDYYWNDETKKRCSKKEPNAILLHKKGDPKLDKEGNQIYQYFFCSPVEKEIFKYTSFNKFLKMLKKCVEYVKRTLLKAYNKRRFFSYITTPKKVSILSKRKITIKNQLINTLNREMYNVPSEYFDDSISHMGFNKIFDRDNYLLRKSYYRMIKKIESALRSDKFENPYSNEVIDLSLYQNFAKYRENLNELENQKSFGNNTNSFDDIDDSDFPEEIEYVEDKIEGFDFPEEPEEEFEFDSDENEEYVVDDEDEIDKSMITNENKKLNIIAIVVSVVIVIGIVIAAIILTKSFGNHNRRNNLTACIR